MAQFDPNFSARLKEAREQAGLSVEEAAERVGISSRAWRMYESGERAVDTRRLRDIAAAVNKTITWLFEETLPSVESEADIPGQERLLEMLARQQEITDRQRIDTTRLLAEQQANISRLTEMLARQQESAIAEREFQQQLIKQGFANLKADLEALRGAGGLEAAKARLAADQARARPKTTQEVGNG